ncbi:hypothetical protein F5Y13DRAFT_177302 [Hypoxylon sp. FL1857]|nr:hypothetical protein F5Y13DRAFT_177302 [Hypoxylon sp. FL1857]
MATKVLLDAAATSPVSTLQALPTSAPYSSIPSPKPLRPTLRSNIESHINPFSLQCNCDDCDKCNNRGRNHDSGDSGGSDNYGSCDGTCESGEKELSDHWLPKVAQLCEYLWPSTQHGTPSINYLSYGSFNVVFSLSMTTTDGQSTEYVLRIPFVSQGYSDIVNTAGILEYLNKFTDLKVPKVITWDATKDNPLENSYIILSRIPGKALKDVWKDLNHHQKLLLAKELAHLYLQIESIINPIAGHLSIHMKKFHHGDEVSNHIFVQPLGTQLLELPGNEIDWCNSENGLLPIERLRHDPPGLSVDDIMLAIFKRRTYYAENRKNPFSFLYDILDKCQEAVDQMVDLELFEPSNDIICLRHPDLFPRNIMVDFSPDITITGILDWDGALFVPRFANRIPPRWLWRAEQKFYGSNSENPDEEPSDPNENEPDSPENAEIKKAFEDTVRESWVSEATDRRYFFVRKLLAFARIDEWKSSFVEESNDSEGSESSEAIIDSDSIEGDIILKYPVNEGNTDLPEDTADNPEHRKTTTHDDIISACTQEHSDDSDPLDICVPEEGNAVISGVTKPVQERGNGGISTETVTNWLTLTTPVPSETTAIENSNAACNERGTSLAMTEEKLDCRGHSNTTNTVPKSAFSKQENVKLLTIAIPAGQEPESNDSETQSEVSPTFAESRDIRNNESSLPSPAIPEEGCIADDSKEHGQMFLVMTQTIE